MRILVTNDDGIAAPGIVSLAENLGKKHELVVAAPEVEQSAAGHSITLSDPLQVKPRQVAGASAAWAVKGTPADCVNLALEELLDWTPDLVVSGINRGPNVGLDILYSGTVSAATEAAFNNRPAMAFSLASFDFEADYGPAGAMAVEMVDLAAEKGLIPGLVLNVNFPYRPDLGRELVRVTRQGTVVHSECYLARKDPRGGDYYWRSWADGEVELRAGTDQAVLAEGLISLTPIQFDLTDHAILDSLAARLDLKRP